MFMKENQRQNSSNLLLQYMFLGTQLMVALCLTVFGGLKADQWLKLSFPLCIWILPLLVIILFMVKLIKDTSKK